MVYLLDKQKMARGHLLIVAIILLNTLSGCTPFYIQFPCEVCDHWICDDPNFYISYPTDSTRASPREETLILNGEVIEVDVCFSPVEFIVFPEGETNHANRLLYGDWEYRNDNLVLIIEEDFIFDGAYSELVFIQGE